jgi:hypothetical protein
MSQKQRQIEGYLVIEYEKSNIWVIENIMTLEDCDKLVDIIDILNLNKISYFKGNNVECYISNINELLMIPDDEYYQFSTETVKYAELLNKVKNKEKITTNMLNGVIHEEISGIDKTMNKYMTVIETIMKTINEKIIFNTHTGYILRKIYGTTRLHTDGLNEVYDSNVTFIRNSRVGEYKMVRNASIIFTLNDNYEDGEFIFPYFDISIKLKKGSVIIFPPFWTHEHGTNSLKNNTFRYTITTWTCQAI